jgi:hypothetical protein
MIDCSIVVDVVVDESIADDNNSLLREFDVTDIDIAGIKA